MIHIPYQKSKRKRRPKEYKSPIVWLNSIRVSINKLLRVEEKEK